MRHVVVSRRMLADLNNLDGVLSVAATNPDLDPDA